MIKPRDKRDTANQGYQGIYDMVGTYLNSERKLDGDHTRENADKNDEMLLFWA